MKKLLLFLGGGIGLVVGAFVLIFIVGEFAEQQTTTSNHSREPSQTKEILSEAQTDVLEFAKKKQEKTHETTRDTPLSGMTVEAENYAMTIALPGETKVTLEDFTAQEKLVEYFKKTEKINWRERVFEAEKIPGVKEVFCGKQGCDFELIDGLSGQYRDGEEYILQFTMPKQDTMQIQSNTGFFEQNAIGYAYHVDEAGAWYFDKYIEEADIESFSFSYSFFHAYAKDKNHVYCRGEILPQADAASFALPNDTNVIVTEACPHAS